MDRVAGDWSGQMPASLPLFPGAWLLPLPEIEGLPGPTRLVAAMALGPEALNSEIFTEICRSARLEVDTAHRALSRLARYDDGDVDRLAATLRVMHADLETLRGNDETVDDFSRELNHSYEQISLLYKLGRSMNWLTKPHEFVLTACNLLAGMLEFPWIAAMYDTPDGQTTRRSTVMSEGSRLPCPPADFERFAGFEAKLELGVVQDGRRRFRGRLLGLDGAKVRMDSGGRVLTLPFDAIVKAKLVMTDDLLATAPQSRRPN